MSILARKSWKDIRRRWARSLFTMGTIAAAVASLALFAVMPLLDRAQDRRVEEDRLHDIQIYFEDQVFSSAEIDELEAIAGVSTVEARTVYRTRMHEGERRSDVLLVGVPEFENQQVNIVQLESGGFPVEAEGLSESQNSRSGRLRGGEGTALELEDNAGGLHPVTVSGKGTTMQYGFVAASEFAVLYMPQSTVNSLAGASGVNTIDVLVESPEEADAVVGAMREWFRANRPETVFTDLPHIREAGTWPGQEESENFTTLFYVGGVLALLSAMALVSNTMTTMVAEQRREVAIMKAVGGRRRQIVGSFMRTVTILAALGTVAGIVVGIPFANFLAGLAGRQFLGVDPDWGYSLPVIGLSVVVGLGVPALAAFPALRRAASTPILEGLAGGLTVSPGTRLEAVLRRSRLSRIRQIGLRNVSRRATRTLGTVLQVALAVGVALGFLALGVTVANETARNWDILHWDVVVSQRSTTGFDSEAIAIIEGLDGFESGHPVLYNTVEIDGTQYEAWGLPTGTDLFEPPMRSGRWFNEGDSNALVAVIGPALSKVTGLQAGDTTTFITASGPADVTIIGVEGSLMNNGTGVSIPLEAFQDLLNRDDTNAYWMVSASQDETEIDRLAAEGEDALGAAGYPASTEIHYVERDANLAANRVLVGLLAIMSVPIVVIGLIGLVNMMTMNVLERTREIGILRCIGAGSRHVSRIFRTEAMTTAFLGWVLALPVGWLLGWGLVWIVGELFNFGTVPYSFPLWSIPVSLAITFGLAWLVVFAPVRRATHLRPGEALRYE